MCIHGLICVLQIVLWDISAHEDRFQVNKALQASDTKSTNAAMVRGGVEDGRGLEGLEGAGEIAGGR